MLITSYMNSMCSLSNFHTHRRSPYEFNRLQFAFLSSLMQRLRRIAPACTYVHRYTSMLRNPAREDLWRLAGTDRKDPRRAQGPQWVIVGAQKAGTSSLFSVRTVFFDNLDIIVQDESRVCMNAFLQSCKVSANCSLAQAPFTKDCGCQPLEQTSFRERCG